MPAAPPSADDLAPLLGGNNGLDAPPAQPADDGDAEFEAAAMTAVGTRAKAMALKDAFDAYLRQKGLITDDDDGADDQGDDGADTDDDSSSVGSGMGNY